MPLKSRIEAAIAQRHRARVRRGRRPPRLAAALDYAVTPGRRAHPADDPACRSRMACGDDQPAICRMRPPRRSS